MATIIGDVPYGAVAYAGLNPSLAARGLIAEAGPVNNSIGGLALVDGTIHFVSVSMFAGMRISGTCIGITTAGVALTLSKVGLYDTSGNRLAISADQGTAWQSAGPQTIPFTAAVTITTTGIYYGAIISKGGTPAAPFRIGQSMVGMGVVNSGLLPFGLQAGQTDLIASATIVAGSGSSPIPWFGFY